MKLPFSPSRSDETGSMKAAPARTRRDWVALGVLMAAVSFVFLWNLDASGYANEFYSAAAQAGSVSWEAFLWGASDSGLAITVDKPPAAIWLMALSVRILGLSSFAILFPRRCSASRRPIFFTRSCVEAGGTSPASWQEPSSSRRPWRRSCSASTTPMRCLSSS